MLLLLASLPALAAEPTLLALSPDPVVGDGFGRVAAVGDAGMVGSVGLVGLAEAAIASRVAVQARVGGEVGIDEPLFGAALRGEILDEATAPIGLGLEARYKTEGFDGVDHEVELGLAASRRLGASRLLVGATVGRDVNEPEGDAELSVGLLHAVGEVVAVGGEARGDLAIGDVEEEDGDEDERRGFDLRAGGTVTAGAERVSGFLFGGAEVIGDGEGTAAGALVSLGAQVSF